MPSGDSCPLGIHVLWVFMPSGIAPINASSVHPTPPPNVRHM